MEEIRPLGVDLKVVLWGRKKLKRITLFIWINFINQYTKNIYK